MTQSELAGEYRDRNVAAAHGRTVVVGVKLDSQSRELLTWVFLKVAHPGDRVIALHVLADNEIRDRDGKASFFSLVKSFDSVLAAYDGVCRLKQVELKLKICRGTSIRKILVAEAKSYEANEVVVGTARTHHTIKSSSSVAKYCAKKLPKSCSIIAVNNGKIVFSKGTAFSSASNAGGTGSSDHHRNRLLSVIHRSLHLHSKVVNDGKCNRNGLTKLELALVKAESGCNLSGFKDGCSICSPDSVLPGSSCVLEESCSDGYGDEDNSMAIVPVQKLEASSCSKSLLLRELPELRPGWPLLRRAILSNRDTSDRSPVRQISVVQWAMRLPPRNCFQPTMTESRNSNTSDDRKNRSLELNAENGAIVAVGGNQTLPASSASPDGDPITLPKELEILREKCPAACRLFKYHELVSATSNFQPDHMIGKGGSSKVYRGCLPDGKELAVKILKTSEDAVKEFVLEIEIITELNHPNIISLFGFCFEHNNLLLVYDFLSRGSLEDNLDENKKKDSAFGWNERYKVAVGVAEALVYLHNRSDQPVIHRDVKSSNILLSDDFEPQLSDFGLAKWASTSSTHLTCTDVAGTFGYLAPEYFMHGKVTDKIDVYAFGVVLLELLSGRKPISREESLVMWAKPILSSGKFARLLDPSLGNNYDADQMERMALASTLCIRRAPRARPQMTTVLKLLRGDVEVTKWARLEIDSTGGSDARLQVTNIPEGAETMEDEGFSQSNLRSHLSLALLDVEDSSLSMSSVEESVSIEDYLRGRWSRSSSFD